MMEDQQLPKTNAEWANYYESIIAELTENQKKIGEPISIDEFYELPYKKETEIYQKTIF